MKVIEVLEEKKQQLLSTGNPLAVVFTIDDINTLADVDELRMLKMSLPFPDTFERSSDLFECTRSIVDGDSYYRILEFCMLKNKVLQSPIKQVFFKIMRD